jgi:hypothetical protein
MSGTRKKRMWNVVLVGLAAGLGSVFHSSARGQGVAFQPEVSILPSGAFVNVTPVVSADRRYVRLSLDTSFTHVNGFTTYSVPAAVSGVSGGAGGLAGLNGLGGHGGGGGGASGRGGSLIQGGVPFGFGGDGGPPIARAVQNPDAVNWPTISPDGQEVEAEDRPAAEPRRRVRANTKAVQSQRAAALRASRQQTTASSRRNHR